MVPSHVYRSAASSALVACTACAYAATAARAAVSRVGRNTKQSATSAPVSLFRTVYFLNRPGSSGCTAPPLRFGLGGREAHHLVLLARQRSRLFIVRHGQRGRATGRHGWPHGRVAVPLQVTGRVPPAALRLRLLSHYFCCAFSSR